MSETLTASFQERRRNAKLKQWQFVVQHFEIGFCRPKTTYHLTNAISDCSAPGIRANNWNKKQ